MHVACTGIVPKPLPELQDLLFTGPGQVLNGGIGGHEFFIVGQPLVNPRLLQDDLRKPNKIGIAGPPPGKIPLVFLVPGKQLVGKIHKQRY